MIEHVLLLDGAEGAESHMQEHFGDLHPHRADAAEQFGRKMQPRRGRRRRTVLAGVYRLVTVGIFELFVDIGRERHSPGAGEHILKRALIEKAHDALARIGDARHLERELFVHGKFRADAAFAPGAHQYLPVVQVDALQKEHLDGAAMLGMGVQPCGQHARAVDDEHVARLQIIGDVVKNAVFDLLRIAVIDKQTGTVARFHRGLRDEFLGKIVPEITLFQNVHSHCHYDLSVIRKMRRVLR